MSITSERRSATRYWPLAVGVLVTAGVAWFVAREFDWRVVWASVIRADVRYIALATAAMLLNILLKAWRWQLLFRPQVGAPPSFRPLAVAGRRSSPFVTSDDPRSLLWAKPRGKGGAPRQATTPGLCSGRSPGAKEVLREGETDRVPGGTEHLRRKDLLSALMIGQLGNVLLPTRLGDVARMGVVHKKAGVALSWALLTLVAEKALDSVMLLILLGALLPFVAWPTWMGTTQLVFGALLAAGLVGLMWLVTQEPVRHRVAKVLQRLLPGPISRWTERTLESLSAWRAVQERPVQVRLWTLSAVIWLLAGLVNHFGFRAVGLQLPLTAGLLLAVTEITGTRLAYTPAAIGIYHSIAIVTLAPFGVGPTDAFSAALLLHLVVYLPILIGGLAAVWWEGLTGIA